MFFFFFFLYNIINNIDRSFSIFIQFFVADKNISLEFWAKYIQKITHFCWS